MRTRSDNERRELERLISDNKRDDFDRARIDDLPIRRDGYSDIDETSPMNAGHHENIHELEISQEPNISVSHEAPPTPPASEYFDPLVDNIIPDLQFRIDRQDATIKRLESDIRSERTRVQELRAAKHEAVQAQRQAILAGNAEVASGKTKISELLTLLDQSTEREKQLESEVDEGKKRLLELQSQLRDARRIQEHEVRSQTWGQGGANRVTRSAELWTQGQGSEQSWRPERQQQRLESDRNAQYVSREAVEVVSETSQTPSRSLVSGRSSKQHEQMKKRGFISVPKSTGHQIVSLDRL